MQRYRYEFSDFCKRSVYKVPPDLLEQNSPESEQRLVLKVSERYFRESGINENSITFEDVLNVKSKISKIIGRSTRSVFIKTVKKGCVEITFAIVSEHKVLPLSEACVKQLEDIGIYVLNEVFDTYDIVSYYYRYLTIIIFNYYI